MSSDEAVYKKFYMLGYKNLLEFLDFKTDLKE